jgi:hypothetical protein
VDPRAARGQLFDVRLLRWVVDGLAGRARHVSGEGARQRRGGGTPSRPVGAARAALARARARTNRWSRGGPTAAPDPPATTRRETPTARAIPQHPRKSKHAPRCSLPESASLALSPVSILANTRGVAVLCRGAPPRCYSLLAPARGLLRRRHLPRSNSSKCNHQRHRRFRIQVLWRRRPHLLDFRQLVRCYSWQPWWKPAPMQFRPILLTLHFCASMGTCRLYTAGASARAGAGARVTQMARKGSLSRGVLHRTRRVYSIGRVNEACTGIICQVVLRVLSQHHAPFLSQRREAYSSFANRRIS